MKKKLLFVIALVVFSCILAVSIGATKWAEGYDYEYELQNKTTLYSYWHINYLNKNSEQVESNVECKDEVTITFLDEQGNTLTSVPLWEFDEESGRYYGLVWYISDYDITSQLVDITVWGQGPDGKWANQPDADGDQRQKLTAVTYTLSKVRAVDLTYEYANDTKTYSYTNSNHENCTWTWSKNGQTFKALKTIYLDADKTVKLQAPVGIGSSNKNQGYETFEAQLEATGNKIVVANLKDLDFQTHYSDYSNKSLWTLATNLQCLWYPDTVVHVASGVGANIREIVFEGIEVIGCQMFRSNKHITEFTVPSKCEYLSDEIFRESGIKTIRYGKGIKIVANAALSGITVNTFYIHSNMASNQYLTGFTNTSWGCGYIINSTKATIYFVGTKAQAEALWAKMSADNTSYTEVYYYDYNSVQERETTTGVAFFYNYSECDAFHKGVHNSSGLTESFVGEEFMSKFKVSTSCTRDCCNTEDVVEELNQLVHPKGYSVYEVPGKKAVTQGFVVNTSLLESYSKYFDNIRYGVLAIGDNGEFNGNLIDKDGNKAHERIAMVDFTNKGYESFEIKIYGFDGYETSKIYFAGFVIADDTVYYLEHDKANEKATTVTFEDMVEILNQTPTTTLNEEEVA